MKIHTLVNYCLSSKETHRISVYTPGSEFSCEEDHLIVGPLGYIVCFENHCIELDMTVADLTGYYYGCLEYAMDPHHKLSHTNMGAGGITERGASDIIVAVCIGSNPEKDFAGELCLLGLAQKIAYHSLEPESLLVYALAANLLIEHGVKIVKIKLESSSDYIKKTMRIAMEKIHG
ncbi:MAG: hypothetical protein WCV79_04245 [Candidatus Paceibacterota bacterium]|jgi:hypothetical protein